MPSPGSRRVIDWTNFNFVKHEIGSRVQCRVALSMGSVTCRGGFARLNGIPSTILGMRSLQKYAVVALVLGASAGMTGEPTGDQNIETMTFGVDIIILGRDCSVTPSGSHIQS
jgi:hypothetical protein